VNEQPSLTVEYCVNHPPVYKAEVQERVEPYVKSTSGPSWTV